MISFVGLKNKNALVIAEQIPEKGHVLLALIAGLIDRQLNR